MKEVELQKMVVEDIRNFEFSEKITYKSKTFFRDTLSFSVNDMLKKKYIECTYDIIEALKCDLDIISNTRNINMTSGRLYTDILTFGIDERFYLFELKVGKKTSREAITELMAYRQEIRNHFPLLSKNEICFIIVAEEYPVLLRHAVTSLLYENIPTLCLRPVFNIKKDNIRQYDVVDIVDWTDLGAIISKELFEGYSILWYSKKEIERIQLSDFTNERIFAIDYLKNEAVKNGQNGFAYIWNRNSNTESLYATGSDFGITVFGVNSYALTYPDLVYYNDSLAEYITSRRGNDITRPVLEVETKKLKELMKGNYYLEVETFNNLVAYENMVFPDFTTIYCDAWGDLGQDLRNFYYKNRKSLFSKENFNQPEVFNKIANLYFLDYPFKNFRGKGEYFQLGTLFSIMLDEKYSSKISDTNCNNLYMLRLVWNILFCTLYKKVPQIVKYRKNILNAVSISNIKQRLIRAERILYKEIKDDGCKIAYEMGKKYADYCEIIPEDSFKRKIKDKPLYTSDFNKFENLQNYFYKELISLIECVNLQTNVTDEEWFILERICISCRVWYPDSETLIDENDILKRKKMVIDSLQKYCKSDNVKKIDQTIFSENCIRNYLRELLNVNTRLNILM